MASAISEAVQSFQAAFNGGADAVPAFKADGVGIVERFFRGLTLEGGAVLSSPLKQHGACFTAMHAINNGLTAAPLGIRVRDQPEEQITRDDPNPARRAVAGAQSDLNFFRLDPEAWGALDDISIDYAVMEKADNLAVVPFTGAWSDLGGWDAVRKFPPWGASCVRD